MSCNAFYLVHRYRQQLELVPNILDYFPLEIKVYQMGKLAAEKVDLGDEKKDIGYLVMMLVGTGNTLEPLKAARS